MFNVWDIGGPASMTTVNQCFFTDKSLYVVIWNLALGEEAVANLQTWLLNIEVIFSHTLLHKHPHLFIFADQLCSHGFMLNEEEFDKCDILNLVIV